VVHHLEPRTVFAAGVLRVVDGGQVHEHVELEGRVVPAAAEHVEEALAGDDDGGVTAVLVGLDDGRREAAAQVGEHLGSAH
jgi:hypothetical protein